MLFNLATLQFGQQLFLWSYFPLTVDRRVHEIVARDQSQSAHAQGKFWPECHSNIKVIDIPVLINQAWEHSTKGIFLIGRDSVKVLPGHTQPHRRIPGGADGIFLPQRGSVLIQRDFFVDVLKLIDVAEFLLPFAFSIKKPIFDAGVTQFDPLGETVVIRVARAFRRYWWSVVKSTLWIQRSKRWCVRNGFFRKKDRIGVVILVGISETAQNRETL